MRFDPLVERWRPYVAAFAVPIGLPVDALLEWIRIESGGDMAATGLPTEAGIWQLMFPGDAKYGATLDVLKAIAVKSNAPGFGGIPSLSPAELDTEVGAGVRKVAAAREVVHGILHAAGVNWPDTSFDFGAAVKQVHALPAVLGELLPQVAKLGPMTWADFRKRVVAFPASRMSPGLAKFALAPSKHGLANRIEDTMANAEEVGRAWAVSSPG